MDGQTGHSGADDGAREADGGVTVEQLYSEVTGGDDEVRLAPDQRAEALLNRVVGSLFDDEFRFDESTVKANLDEVLLLLIAGRDTDRHGKALMTDLTAVFDTHMSPGTVYPRLHELEEQDTLRVQELVRTKEYQIADETAVEKRVERSMRQHLAMGLLLRAALADLL
jgi:DNA-binding PadR family transcriptional regulator